MRHIYAYRYILLLISLWSVQAGLIAAASGNSGNDEDWIYVTRPGDNLKAVGERFLAPGHEWHKLLKHNELTEPFVLAPGLNLKIPVAWLKQAPQSAVLTLVRNEVWIRRAQEQAYKRAQTNDQLQVGDELKTANGSAMLRFADGSETDVADNTRLILNRMTRFGPTGMMDTRYRLLEGSIENRVEPVQKPAGRYEVTTPGAVAAVRGTVFRIHSEDSQTRTEVLEGRVELTNSTAAVVLEQGEGAVNGDSQISQLPLPAAPELQIDSVFQNSPIKITWATVESATAYHVRLFEQMTGKRILDQQTAASSLTLPPLKNGWYKFSVRATDENRLEGPDTAAAFEVRQAAPTAVLLSPEEAATVENDQPLFEWQSGQAGLLSSLEISRQADFAELVTRTAFAPITATKPEMSLPAGQYYWRIVTLAGGDEFSYSAPRSLSIVGKLSDTRIIAVNYARSQVKVFWRKVPAAISYELQVAEDEFFNYVRNTLSLPETHAILKLDPGKTWYLRVRAIGGPLTVSQFGVAEPIWIKAP